MIKIKIENPHWIHKDALRLTAEYLLKMSETIIHDEILSSPINEENEVIPNSISDDIKKGILEVKDSSVNEIIKNNEDLENKHTDTLGPRKIVHLGTGYQIDWNGPLPENYSEVTPAFNPFKPTSNAELKQMNYQDFDLDSRGFPWDERIHARTKTKNKDGSWKYLRGVGPKIVSDVESEFINARSPGIPEEKPIIDFSKLMEFITKSIIEKKLNRDQITPIIMAHGIQQLSALSSRPDLVPAVYSRIEEIVNNAQ